MHRPEHTHDEEHRVVRAPAPKPQGVVRPGGPPSSARPGSEGGILTADHMMELQQAVGNRAVQRLLGSSGRSGGSQPALQGKGAAIGPAAAGVHVSVQRVPGIPEGTYVGVTEGGRTWYGRIVRRLPGAYEIRLGGTERTVTVPEGQVDFHPTVRAMNPETVGAHLFIQMLPTLDITAELATFASQGTLARQLVDALALLEPGVDARDTAAHTLAMFSYLYRYASVLGTQLDADVQRIATRSLDRTQSYLRSCSASIMPKLLGKGLWAGEDRELIGAGAQRASHWFKEGRTALLQKAQETLSKGKTLDGLLAAHAHNLDAKSYGRRVYALSEDPTIERYLASTTATAPPVDTAVRYGSVVKVKTLYDQPISLDQLEREESYWIWTAADQTTPFTVTVSENNVDEKWLKFSEVE